MLIIVYLSIQCYSFLSSSSHKCEEPTGVLVLAYSAVFTLLSPKLTANCKAATQEIVKVVIFSKFVAAATLPAADIQI